jgi:hypothetical protein
LDLSSKNFSLDSNKSYWVESFSNAPLVVGPFTFDHSGAEDWGGYWGGYTVSANGDSDDYGSSNSTHTGGWIPHQWGNMAGGGIKTDAEGNVVKNEDGVIQTEQAIPYLIGNGSDVSNIDFDITYEVVGMYVNNHPWPYYENIYGGAFARALNQEGDYFKLIIRGLDENGIESGSVEYLLAEYKDGELIQSTNWEWLDLSSLGRVKGLSITFQSTDMSTYGMNTSAYFCLDKLQLRDQRTGIQSPHSVTTKVYPNPASDWLTIESRSKIEQITVSDISGKTVYQNNNIADFRLNIPVSTLAKGTYIVRLVDKSGVSVQKFIKK